MSPVMLMCCALISRRHGGYVHRWQAMRSRRYAAACGCLCRRYRPSRQRPRSPVGSYADCTVCLLRWGTPIRDRSIRLLLSGALFSVARCALSIATKPSMLRYRQWRIAGPREEQPGHGAVHSRDLSRKGRGGHSWSTLPCRTSARMCRNSTGI